MYLEVLKISNLSINKFTIKKLKMKKMSGFYMSKHKKAKDLVNQLETIEVDNQRNKLKKLISQRKNKWKQVMGSYEAKLPKFNYLKKNYSEFSLQVPLSSKQPFIPQKKKQRLATSERAFSSSANMKVTVQNEPFQKNRNSEDKQIINKQFLEYDRVIDSQSGIKKIEALEKLDRSLFIRQEKKYAKFKNTYFQKLRTDKYNFYDSHNFKSIRGSLVVHSKTDREMNYSSLMQKSKLASSTIDSSKMGDNSTLDYITLNKSRLKKSNDEFQGYSKRSDVKKRIKSQLSHKLATISFDRSLVRNLNSIQS